MVRAADRIELFRAGSRVEDLFPLFEGDDLVPISMQDQDWDFDFSDFLHRVVAGAEKGSEREKGKYRSRHLPDGGKGGLKDQGGAFFACGQVSGDSRPQRAAEEDDPFRVDRSEEHTSELQSQSNLVCRLLL